MKSLRILQTLAKIGKVFSKIIRIFCVIGFIGCIVGIVAMAAGATALRLNGRDLEALIFQASGCTNATLYAIMAVGMILCAGEWVLSGFANRYFANELAAGTPFTESGAQELLRLGILTIAIPLGSEMLASIANAVISALADSAWALSLDNGDSVALGVMFIVISLLCRYGAELREEGK